MKLKTAQTKLKMFLNILSIKYVMNVINRAKLLVKMFNIATTLSVNLIFIVMNVIFLIKSI